MSIRSEIRAALVDGPKTTDELLPLVPSVDGDRRKLGWSMNDLAGNQMVRRAGLSEDGKPLYQLDPKVWPEKPDSAEATGAAMSSVSRAIADVYATAAKKAKARGRKPAIKAPGNPARKARAPASKPPRKTRKASAAAPALPAVIASEVYEVGLMASGEALVHNRSTGAVTTIPRAVVAQIAAMRPLGATA